MLSRFALTILLGAYVSAASCQEPANPLEGTWTTHFEKAGKLLSKKRIELRVTGGWFYDVQKHYAGDPKGVCRNLRAPLEAVRITETTVHFTVARAKVIAGCSNLEFALERRGEQLVGTMTGVDDEGEAHMIRAVTLSR